MKLEVLFKKYKTDKLTHNYHTIYDKYLSKLKNKKLKILEIGVSDGSSLQAWSNYFKKSAIIGIDINKPKKKKKFKKNIFFYQGSQTDKAFLKSLIKKYEKFDIIIDDGSHYPSDVIFTFKNLFDALNLNGFYFIEDTQTSYNHFFGGNPFDLKYANTHVNYFKSLCDSLNYKEIANPFYKKSKFDGFIKNISFYNNMIAVEKNYNNNDSNLLLDNSYENKRYITKIGRSNTKIRYFLKYKVIFRLYTYLYLFFNLIKRLILFRF